jgi:hypothetical protein
MRVQEAIVRELTKTTTATYALASTRVYWNLLPKNPTFPFVRVSKVSKRPILQGLTFVGEPSITDIQVGCFAKTQEAAADLADAVYADLAGYGTTWQSLPLTSPVTGDALTAKIEPTGEEDLISDDLIDLGVAGEARTFSVHTR